MEREILGKVVAVEKKEEETFLVKLECEALEDVTAFEITSVGLNFSRIGVTYGAGSCLDVIGKGDPRVEAGDLIPLKVRSKDGHRFTPAELRPDPAVSAKDADTLASSEDKVNSVREDNAAPRDTGDQGGGQN